MRRKSHQGDRMQFVFRRFVVAVATFAGGAVAQAAAGEQWEYRMSLVTPDGASMPMNTVTACRSAAAALRPAPQANCRVEDYQPSGNTASFRLVCGPPQPMTMSGEVTRSGDTVSGTLRLRQNGQDLLMKQSARKLGGCSNPID